MKKIDVIEMLLLRYVDNDDSCKKRKRKYGDASPGDGYSEHHSSYVLGSFSVTILTLGLS